MTPMKRFRVVNDDFWAHGVGAFAWRWYDPSHPDRDSDDTVQPHAEGAPVASPECMLILVPAPRFDRGFECLRVFPSHAPNNWAQPGSVDGWDGDRERPTLTPSLNREAEGAGGWHGFIKAGRITP